VPSLVHVLEWRAAVNPDAIALTDQLGLLPITSLLVRHPGAADVAVIGIPDERWGETVLRAALREPFWAGRVRLVS
jgi:acyl-coenzyme A synthetase/AMP-(fatty) acid ligase